MSKSLLLALMTALRQLRLFPIAAGDVVVISAGSYVPADLLLLEGGAVLDESELTGETKPIQKLPFSRGLSEGDDAASKRNDEEGVPGELRRSPGSQGFHSGREAASSFDLDDSELRASTLFAG